MQNQNSPQKDKNLKVRNPEKDNSRVLKEFKECLLEFLNEATCDTLQKPSS